MARLRRDFSFAHQDSENIFAGQDDESLALNCDLGCAVLGEEDCVADFDIHRDASAVLISTSTDGDDNALLWLLLCLIGNDETRDCDFLCLLLLDDDAVIDWLDWHCFPPVD